jgi:hypothetical protein
MNESTIPHSNRATAPLPQVQQTPAIPPHIAGNLLEFLRRVQSTGMEAVAWVEAYQFVQRYAPQPQPLANPPPKDA